MAQLSRFAILILAMLLIPWLAATPPPWRLLTDSGWAQAVGSVVAILAGFGYVTQQNRWQEKATEKREREYRRYMVGVAGAASDAAATTYLHFYSAFGRGAGVTAMPGQSHLDIVADELMGANTVSSGNAEFTWNCRQIAHFAKAFSSYALMVATNKSPVTDEQLKILREHREVIGATWRDLKKSP